MPARHKRLMKFIRHSIQNGKRPRQPAIRLFPFQRTPITNRQKTIPKHMTAFLHKTVKAAEIRQTI